MTVTTALGGCTWAGSSGTGPGAPAGAVRNVVVVATVRSGTATPDVVTLRFINAKTGALVASRSLHVWDFTGIRADTIGGEPVVEARYTARSRRCLAPSRRRTRGICMKIIAAEGAKNLL